MPTLRAHLWFLRGARSGSRRAAPKRPPQEAAGNPPAGIPLPQCPPNNLRLWFDPVPVGRKTEVGWESCWGVHTREARRLRGWGMTGSIALRATCPVPPRRKATPARWRCPCWIWRRCNADAYVWPWPEPRAAESAVPIPSRRRPRPEGTGAPIPSLPGVYRVPEVSTAGHTQARIADQPSQTRADVQLAGSLAPVRVTSNCKVSPPPSTAERDIGE